MRDLARKLLLNILGPLSIVRSGTYFLNGHFISEKNFPAQTQIAIFDQLLKALSKDFDLVSPGIALENISQKGSRLLSLTFDDGFSENATVIAPVMDSYNAKGLFFINPDYLDIDKQHALRVLKEKYLVNFEKTFLTKEQVRRLAANGHVIGSHTSSHLRLFTSDRDLLHDELIRSRHAIESITGQNCNTFAYPFGGVRDISDLALQIALANYDFVFSSTTSKRSSEFDGHVINRRHFEGNWPSSHIKYFLSRRG